MSLDTNALSPEKIKELLADPNSWLSKKQANENLEQLDYLAIVKNIIAVEMAQVAMKAQELQNRELEAQAKKYKNERETFNQQVQVYNDSYKQLYTMASDLASSNLKDPRYIIKMLEEISAKLAAQIQTVWVTQQRSFANQVVDRLDFTLSDGQSFNATQTAKDDIRNYLSDLPLSMMALENQPPAIAEARSRHTAEYLQKNAKNPNNPSLDERLNAQFDTSKKFRDTEKLAAKQVEFVANRLRKDHHDQVAQRNNADQNPSINSQINRHFDQHAHRIMIVDLNLVENLNHMLTALLIHKELTNSIKVGLSSDMEDASALLARHGFGINITTLGQENRRMSP